MTFTDTVSALIFFLIVIAVFVYLIMSGFVVGPIGKLRRAEKVILGISVAGIALVLVYAALELLLFVVF